VIGYVVVVNDPTDLAEFTAQLSDLAPLALFESPSYGAVLIESPVTHECDHEDLWSLPDRDLAGLSSRHPCLEGRHPNLAGRSIGSRWPVIWRCGEARDLDPNEVDVTVNFENLILDRATRDHFIDVCRLVAHLLSRYRSLADAIADCQAALRHAGSDDEGLLAPTTRHNVLAARSRIALSSVLSDPTPQIYWEFEAKVVDQLSQRWGLERIEQAAHHVMTSTKQILDDETAVHMRRTLAQRSRQLRLVKAILAALSILNLVSAALGLLEFATAESSLRSPSGTRLGVAVGLVVMTIVGLVALFSYSRRASFDDDKTFGGDALTT